jgi:cyclohexanone monooxygenase
MPEALPNADPIEGLGFDPEALAAKYRDERSKRLREDGIHQYREAKGALQQFADDPHVERLDRKPVDDDCEILIIGGGFGGLVVAAHLQEAGISNIRIVEKAGDFGGVWYWNRYPGARCDTER